MTRTGLSILVAIVAGVAAVYLLPASWLAPLCTGAAVCSAISALIARLETKTGQRANPLAGALLLLLNLPERPLAEVRAGWALTIFLVTAAFLGAIALSVMVRASS